MNFKNKNFKSMMAFFIALAMVCTSFFGGVSKNVFAKTPAKKVVVKKAPVKKTLKDIVKENVASSSKLLVASKTTGDWQALAIARSGKLVPKTYLQNLNLSKLRSSTDYERAIIGILAAGGNPTKIKGINLVDKLLKANLVEEPINSMIFGLMALDAGNYEIPQDTKFTREDLINKILSEQNKDGGWALIGNVSDADTTAMAMIALSPYNNSDYSKVQVAIRNGVKKLSLVQKALGKYAGTYEMFGAGSKISNTNSTAQVAIALCVNGVDPTSKNFTKSGVNVIQALLKFKASNGGFGWKDNKFNGLATEQVLLAFDQYLYYLDKKGSIFTFVKKTTSAKKITVRVEGDENTLFNKEVVICKETTSLDILKKAIGQDKVTISESQYGKYISKIFDLEAKKYGGYDGWCNYFFKDNKVITPMESIDAQKISGMNEVVFYYGNASGLTNIPKVDVKEIDGKYEFNVTAELTDWNTGVKSVVPVEGANIKVDKVGEFKTDKSGKTLITVPAGTYGVSIEKYTEKGPEIVKQTLIIKNSK